MPENNQEELIGKLRDAQTDLMFDLAAKDIELDILRSKLSDMEEKKTAPSLTKSQMLDAKYLRSQYPGVDILELIKKGQIKVVN